MLEGDEVTMYSLDRQMVAKLLEESIENGTLLVTMKEAFGLPELPSLVSFTFVKSRNWKGVSESSNSKRSGSALSPSKSKSPAFVELVGKASKT